MALTKVSLSVPDLATAEDISASLTGMGDDLRPLATTLFEEVGSGYLLEAYYEHGVDIGAVAPALRSRSCRIGRMVVQALPDKDWVAVSQAALPPVRAGPFIVHGSHDRAAFAGRRRAVEIEAGAAFGTGYNATTTLCLKAIDREGRRRRFRHIVDLGCGSGVLAIAAARAFPAARVIATDNDPVAVAVARANARLNNLARNIRIIHAEGFAHPAMRSARNADLVIANILPNTLIEIASAVHGLLARNGIAILSGVLTHQVRELASAYRSAGFGLVRREEDQGWTALTVARR
jgi:ribosomal protein L11 methyltransferase